jgi:oxygen-independent coproporphyrinogen III oxidase
MALTDPRPSAWPAAFGVGSPFPVPRALYVHLPFCRRRCGYCNFTVVSGRDDLHDRYLEALRREIAAGLALPAVDSLYLGGGTPTELAAPRLDRLCGMLRASFPLADGHEWSIEANPLAVDAVTLRILRSWGVNRISLGVQSFHGWKLRWLERDHRRDDILGLYPLVRDLFPSVSIDLICGVPGESLAAWRRDLEQAIRLGPDHISIYSLTLEKGSSFFGRALRGHWREPDEETQRTLLETAWDQLAEHGWEHYEVSNFARPGHRCRHNEVYWKGEPYQAAGAGASRYVDGRRETNHRSTFTYLRRVEAGRSPVAEAETLSPENRAREMLVFRLRMLEGISRREFLERTGWRLEQLAGRPLSEFLALGLIEDRDGQVRLTRSGLMISDAMWAKLLRA